MNSTDKLIERFASKLKEFGVPVCKSNNQSRLELLESKLPKRLPCSFFSFLSGYSFPAFDVSGISLFAWESDASSFIEEASVPKGSLSELLIPAGYVQIGQPDTGSFDAVCFDLTQHRQNREYRIVQVDHEEILCNWRVRVTSELWSSFIQLVETAVNSEQARIFYQEPR
jgi:hypothetical protein